MPDLCQRSGDIPLLVEYFLKLSAEKNNRPTNRSRTPPYNACNNGTGPLNVRELENTIERAVVLSKSDTIDVADLPKHLHNASPSSNTLHFPVGTSLAEIERHVILATLASVDGKQNQSRIHTRCDSPNVVSQGSRMARSGMDFMIHFTLYSIRRQYKLR